MAVQMRMRLIYCANPYIDDKVYKGTDAENIRAILRELLSLKTQPIEINWRDIIGQTMLSEQLPLTRNSHLAYKYFY
ncbi:hypothetical protein NIES267_38560 [Calothrix parasitica NIES-267]|uniref:Uncharacterized protein n=1 Tax=Calothrix parasitica NIES-267 TaxID=1973488 RepID=A0A1Z4LSY3_9CYAN|nr:hypothetical protein NIES267_38560 [Calothrix parasitica NIES-267]